MYHDDPQAAQVILDNVTDGVFTVDREWKITSFNRAAERITGVSHDEAIGRRCCDVFRASICESDCVLRRTIKTDQPVVNKAIYIIDAADRKIPISVSTAILRNEAGEIIGGVESFRDLSQVEDLRRELEGRYTFHDIIGRSPAMQSLFELLPVVAESDSSVLVHGASGTGKELVARAIHDLSPRKKKRFVAINCGALPDALLESELFGHKAGAFTDARKDKPGRFAVADGGTILLDEIGDISPAMQVRLLRVLQERQVEPLGSVDPVPVDVRVIAATHRDLARLVQEGSFREDLFYRMNVFRVDLPLLRDRREDIPLLVDHFISRFNARQSKDVSGVSDEVMNVLMRCEFPGNARELENTIEHAFVLCRSGMIELRHLPREILDCSGLPVTTVPPGASLKSVEAIHIADTLRRHDGNRTATAEELGIHPTTLRRKIKALDIDVPVGDGRSQRGKE
ncbi:MAG: sigma 54-interacting transcriptional regulator [Thermoanaerobaculales bacterium]|jgi:PAS domain S-box-containing protein|nr:sigma 54-interacting transcriptional regulator [Thermoanaerobaculales bacterium]